MRQLDWLARGRDKQQWNHTSSLIATLFNTRAFAKGKPVRPQQFHPYLAGSSRGGQGMQLTKHTLKYLALAMGAEGLEQG